MIKMFIMTNNGVLKASSKIKINKIEKNGF